MSPLVSTLFVGGIELFFGVGRGVDPDSPTAFGKLITCASLLLAAFGVGIFAMDLGVVSIPTAFGRLFT